uniref:Uncharacterized protein n=1 Tax=Hemiselmis andersenii TaxID=464988 RepID=A0A7S1H453_HEMAN
MICKGLICAHGKSKALPLHQGFGKSDVECSHLCTRQKVYVPDGFAALEPVPKMPPIVPWKASLNQIGANASLTACLDTKWACGLIYPTAAPCMGRKRALGGWMSLTSIDTRSLLCDQVGM